MELSQVTEMGRDLLGTALLISMPALLASLLIGVIISILQAVTSIQEQTLSFVPRLIGVGLVLVLTLGWVLQVASQFTVRMFHLAAGVVQ